jgi:aerotaxis receptor
MDTKHMKMNLPVTGREFDYDAGQMLVSTTDLKGRIAHANDAFVAVSGFTREEILGKAHNIVRHPDMPPAAFADMWTTIQSGQPWTGLVKNRRKNGDHYWVRANVTPVMSKGVVTGFLSVRVKPSRADVDAAETLYREMREDRAKGVTMVNGKLRPTGLRGTVAGWLRWGVSGRVGVSSALAALGPLVAAALGLGPWVVAGLAVACAGILAAWLIATLARPIGEVQQAVWRLAAADLSVRLDSGREDELGDIARGLSQMALNLTAVVTDVTSGAVVLTTATSEIASGNTDLSQRTETQAANLEQTAASMEQLNATVKNSALTAREAALLANTASQSAAHGGEVMGHVVATMDEIATRSNRINVIISVIDGIAFQTNILALNAAVEAARAGEQGRGFAVVASEVRSLAQRSAEAAREIKALIGASVEKVDAGTKLVRDAGGSINDIVAQVRQVAQMIDQISNATNEQTLGISQVNDAVTQLDQVTQQNAALVEEAAAAAESLNQQAARLVEAVSVFHTGQSEAVQTIARAQQTSRATVKSKAGEAVASPLKRPATPSAQPVARAPKAPAEVTDAWESF